MVKILAIDDNKFNLISLNAIINDSFPGSTLYTALDGFKGIELAIANDPDVILLDIIMPGMDGFEVCRHLKQDERVFDIPVVFLTAMKGDKDYRIKAVESGAEAFLSKPIDPTELTVQIKAMVKIKLANRLKRDEKERLTMLVAERTHELEQSQVATLNLVDELKAENESHRKTEDKLRESEELFRNIFEYHTAVKLIIDPDKGTIIDANIAAESYYGWPKEKLKQMNIQDINTFRPEKISKAMEMAAKREQEHFEFRHRLADGSIRDVEVFSSKIEVNGKSLLHSIVHDISDRKQIEETIKKSEANLNSLINNRDESIWSIDNNYNFIIFNNFFRDEYFASFNIELKKGMNVLEILSPQWRDFWKPKYDKALLGKRIVFEYSNRVGEVLHFYEVFLNPIITDGKITGVSALSAVITKRKMEEEALRESEAQLHELNATKDKFFSIIAHDLKSPFNAVIGFSDMLIEQVQNKNYDGIEEYAEIIRDSSKRAMDLLANLMEWSRSKTGRMEFNPEIIDIVELINEVTALLSHSAKQKSITISKETPDIVTVFADKAMTCTILRNLISNAIKFTQPEGQVVILVHPKISELIVSVQDSGVGITQENIDKLFRIEVNHSTLGTQNERGTGLGLILCKEFIEKHGGTIWVESEVGKGSKFCFTIPKN